ncbi:MAG: HD domain-containing phosphohydrolase [Thermodesulfobacteriota bacterium]
MKQFERIDKRDIALETPLPQDIYDRNGVLLLKKGYLIKTQKQLTSLFERGASILIPEPLQEPIPKAAPPPKIENPTPFELIDTVYSGLSALCLTSGSKFGFQFKIIELCKKIQLACSISTHATLGAILLRKESSYSIAHQLHCAILCDILLRATDHPPSEHSSLLAAALTMNIAMLKLQTELFSKKGELSDEQKKAIKNHPQEGMERLHSNGVRDEIWLKAVLEHHEFLDGSGYPKGLEGKEITVLARMLTLADVYCVKLFSRAYRLPLPPDVAAREIITGSRGQALDQELAKVLVKEIGIFHPGSFVRLINGEIALVTQSGKKIHHPLVHSVIKEDGVPFPKPVRRDCSKETCSIVYSIPAHQVGIELDLKRLWGFL